MNESQEQFRERIRLVMKDADRRYEETHPKPPVAKDIKAYSDWYLGGERTAVEAVYAQAVRDVLVDIEREFEPRLAAWFRGWADERGIQLASESEKTP